MSNGPQNHLYLENSNCLSVQTELSAAGQDDDGVWLVLVDNVFHPQGGGQPADRGTVDGYAAVPFRLSDNRSVVAVRLIEPGGTFTIGQRVSAAIDPESRRLHAALHTAGHVVQAIAESRHWSVVANNHFPGQARVEFTTPPSTMADLSTEENRSDAVTSFQNEADEVIARKLPVTATEDENGFRTVQIGDWHSTPCGGTHVDDLGELNAMRISSIRVKGGKVRVAYEASHREGAAK